MEHPPPTYSQSSLGMGTKARAKKQCQAEKWKHEPRTKNKEIERGERENQQRKGRRAKGLRGGFIHPRRSPCCGGVAIGNGWAKMARLEAL